MDIPSTIPRMEHNPLYLTFYRKRQFSRNHNLLYRVIFLWLCTKDLGKMQFTNVQPGSPEEILLNVKQGKASYAQIYETLCSYAGLHCRVIRGYAKGADYKPGMSVLQAGAMLNILWS